MKLLGYRRLLQNLIILAIMILFAFMGFITGSHIVQIIAIVAASFAGPDLIEKLKGSFRKDDQENI